MENFPAHEISVMSFQPSFDPLSLEKEDDTGQRRQKRALDPSLLEGLNREEECEEEREIKKKQHCLKLTVGTHRDRMEESEWTAGS